MNTLLTITHQIYYYIFSKNAKFVKKMDYVPFPRFSSEKLDIWFARVESVFNLNGIISDSDKYDYIVAQIPLEFTSMLEDILLNPPPASKYDHIKYEFIKRMSIYWMKKEELGEDMPSKYLERLIKMADTRVPIELILNTWLNNLPKPVREILSLETSGHIEVLEPMADKIMQVISERGERIKPSQCDQFELVLKRIDELGEQVLAVQLMLDGECPQVKHMMGIGKQERDPAVPGCSIEKVPNKNRLNPQRVIYCYHNIGSDERACPGPCFASQCHK